MGNDITMTARAGYELSKIPADGWQKCLALLQITCANTLAENVNDSTEIAEYRRKLADYIEICKLAKVKAGNLGAYAAMGVTKSQISHWKRGESGAEKQNFALQVTQLFSAFRESLSQEGYISPPVAIFWAKNFDGLSDAPKEAETQSDALGEGISSKEIADKYKDIIIDDD